MVCLVGAILHNLNPVVTRRMICSLCCTFILKVSHRLFIDTSSRIMLQIGYWTRALRMTRVKIFAILQQKWLQSYKTKFLSGLYGALIFGYLQLTLHYTFAFSDFVRYFYRSLTGQNTNNGHIVNNSAITKIRVQEYAKRRNFKIHCNQNKLPIL